MSDVKLIKMTREEPDHPGGPTTAEVHPDEVQGWEVAGWSVAGPETKKPKAKE